MLWTKFIYSTSLPDLYYIYNPFLERIAVKSQNSLCVFIFNSFTSLTCDIHMTDMAIKVHVHLHHIKLKLRTNNVMMSAPTEFPHYSPCHVTDIKKPKWVYIAHQ